MINDVWIDEDRRISPQKLIGESILEEVRRYIPPVKKLLDKLPARYTIPDISEADGRKIVNRQARARIVQYSSRVGYGKVAYINISPALYMIAKVLRKIAGSKNEGCKNEIVLFNDEEDVKVWLKGDK